MDLEATRAAERLLGELEAGVPVDPARVARALGIQVIARRSPTTSRGR